MPRGLFTALGAFILLGGIAGGVALRHATAPPAAAAARAPAAFSLIDHNGRRVSDATYRGKQLLVFFGFTHCPDVCPTTMAKAAEILNELGPLAGKLQVLFVSVDSRRDTPEVLKEYLANFDERLVGLTGSAAQVAAAAKTFGVHYEEHLTGFEDNEGAPDYAFDHSNAVYRVDATGALLRAYIIDDANLRVDLRAALENMR